MKLMWSMFKKSSITKTNVATANGDDRNFLTYEKIIVVKNSFSLKAHLWMFLTYQNQP